MNQVSSLARRSKPKAEQVWITNILLKAENEMRFAICQELYEDTPWDEQCRRIAEAGYTGIEVAPFAISSDLASVPRETLLEMKQTAADAGLEIIGLHWLLAKTNGLHLTSPDLDVRSATADYLCLLAKTCAALGGSVMVFGSPPQRSLLPGVSAEQGMEYAADVFRMAIAAFEQNNVLLCVEPLTPKETDFLNTCQQAVELIEMVNHPTMRLHQDVKAMLGGESEPVPVIIDKYKNYCSHFHVNDSNLLGPGMGDTDFHPIMKALQESGYDGWVSVEVFDYSPGADKIARQSISYLNSVLEDNKC
jgi:sugar phosphate isomerase/epimerase